MMVTLPLSALPSWPKEVETSKQVRKLSKFGVIRCCCPSQGSAGASVGVISLFTPEPCTEVNQGSEDMTAKVIWDNMQSWDQKLSLSPTPRS